METKTDKSYWSCFQLSIEIPKQNNHKGHSEQRKAIPEANENSKYM